MAIRVPSGDDYSIIRLPESGSGAGTEVEFGIA